MSDRPPLSKNPAAPALEALTADWSPLSQTATFDLQSTPGPNDALLQTIAKVKAEFSPSQFPQLPGLTVVGYIDCGGMGHVYRAEQATPKRTVAVKIATSFNRAGMVTRERFDREIQALAAVSHPNIMPIYTAGDWHGFPFYAMRYMPGGPLSKSIPRLAGQTTAIAALMRKVARGLQSLHEAGIIHRDLKPHNILLDGNDEPLIADFGLAKWLDGSNSELTMTASVLGTKYYMPPEQTTGSKEEYGPASDIWAFGIILYELLVGRRPFHDDLPGSIFEQIRSTELEIPDTVPEGLATVIRRCLQKRPEYRYPNAAALGVDLDSWLAGEAIPQRAIEQSRTTRGLRSRRGFLFGSALVAIGSAVAVGAAVWPKRTAETQRSIAARLRDGETVTLIGPKGLPDGIGKPLLGTRSTMQLDSNGYCMLGSAGTAGVKLVDEEIEVPLEIACEYAFLSSRQDSSHAGIFIAHREVIGVSGRTQNSTVQLTHKVKATPDGEGRKSMTETATLSWHVWGADQEGCRNDIESVQRTIVVPLPDTEIHWRKVVVRMIDGVAASEWQGRPLQPVPFAQIPGFFPGVLLPPPTAGHGIGVTVHNTDAIFRNLTLTPIPHSR